MKIIHCSDLHLDSPMESNLDPSQAKIRNKEIRFTFSHMVQFAKEQNVNAIMICGDLFDSNIPHRDTVEFILNLINQNKSITFFYLCGNHDEKNPLRLKSIPTNLMLFDYHWKYYRCNHITIGGVVLNHDNYETVYQELNLDPEHTNIIMMHGQVGAGSGPDNIAVHKLSGKSIDYLALGHIHSFQTGTIDHRGTYCYSGCLEGRGFDETGPKGFVLLTIEQNSIQSEFFDFAQRHLHKLTTDISSCMKFTDILNIVQDSLRTIDTKDLVHISMTGRNQLNCPIDTDFIENILSEQYFFLKITDASVINRYEEQTDAVSLKTEFMKSVNNDESLTSEEKEFILRIGFAAISGKEIII